MKKVLLMMILVSILILPVSAMEFEAPDAPKSAKELMPDENSGFTRDLIYVIKAALEKTVPNVTEACRICLSIIAVTLLVSVLHTFSGNSKKVVTLAGTLAIGILLLQPAGSLVNLGAETVNELTEYNKLLLPVMAAALAAQGGANTSAALYMGTAALHTVLTSVISKLIIPMMYIYICLCIASSAIQEQMLKKLRGLCKWLITWCLKITLYIFTGYMGITGVVSGTTDAAAVKAAKLTINGAVPVVGNILSDASEAILVSAGVMKNAAGIYGLIAIIAILIGPFLKIAIQYLLLKLTDAICGTFGSKELSGLVQDFSGAMGLILAMTGTVSLLLLISVVCFMKGVA